MKNTAIALLLALAACDQTAKPAPPPAAAVTTPAEFKVKFITSRGDFVVKVVRAWSPNGADRFHELVKAGFYDDVRFFRVVPGFMVQFGISGDPKAMAKWRERKILDDPVKQSNTRGRVTFAMAGPNTRTTQIFINFADQNAGLDGQGFSPFGEIIDGMNVVDSINAEYRETPDQQKIQEHGNDYLKANFPNLDYVKSARVE